MTREEVLKGFEYVVADFIKTHASEISQNIRWGETSEDMVFGQADISSNDFVLILLRTFRNAGARIIDSGTWQPFPNFAFPINPPGKKLHAEETIDWNGELGGNQ